MALDHLTRTVGQPFLVLVGDSTSNSQNHQQARGIQRSPGITRTERQLAQLCEQSFLKLWSYPNPCRDDGHELCDLLAVFYNRLFIFFDRDKKLDIEPGGDFRVAWDRWKRDAIDSQINSCHGAERYIRSGRKIYLDALKKEVFPVDFDRSKVTVHKIIVAHGAAEACKKFFSENASGSLAVSYGEPHGSPPFPFFIDIDSHRPVHVFDTETLPILLRELDTVADFSMYIDAKEEAIARLRFLVYTGEEDLLAHYFMNFDDAKKRHFIGTLDPTINGVMIEEGQWVDFQSSRVYTETKQANSPSYLWDELLQRTAQNALDGILLGNPAHTDGPILEMAKEPRFSRRALSEHMIASMRNFPDSVSGLARSVSLMPSFYPGKSFVFLQVWGNTAIHDDPEYRSHRQQLLRIACGAAKNTFPEIQTIVGIGMDAPKHAKDNSEDFLLLDCSRWTTEDRANYAELNTELRFFASPDLKRTQKKASEFINASDNHHIESR